jgi:hypothetical protein
VTPDQDSIRSLAYEIVNQASSSSVTIENKTPRTAKLECMFQDDTETPRFVMQLSPGQTTVMNIEKDGDLLDISLLSKRKRRPKYNVLSGLRPQARVKYVGWEDQKCRDQK